MNTKTPELIQKLTGVGPDFEEYPQLLSEFSYEFGWRPGDTFKEPTGNGRIANAHLIVEHGLQNSAVLSFLPADLAIRSQPGYEKTLLGLSYNNLVDWHVLIERDRVRYVFNRTDPPTTTVDHRIGDLDYSALQSERLAQAIGAAPSPNVPALDDALIETISRWKRLIAAELDSSVSNASLSALFNAILLARAIEDHHRGFGQRNAQNPANYQLLAAFQASNGNITLAIETAVRNLSGQDLPAYLWDPKALAVFANLGASTLRTLLQEFYFCKGVPYRYDFSVMSKHALSRIYERYVSVLRFEESAQLWLITPIPEEERNKALGGVYTPQFIAKFFARFLKDNLPAPIFRKARVADLACGSGIFLRSVMEVQLQSIPDIRAPQDLDEAVRNLVGVDVDPNAVAASMLSLAVLYLNAAGSFPTTLSITTSEAIAHYLATPQLNESLDAFIVNPPFVRTEVQPDPVRERIANFMAGIASGRIDMYLPFVKMGINSLKPGRFGCFVLPQTFLVSESASGVRKFVTANAWVRCIVDLSSIPVFGSMGSYVILLLVEKKSPSIIDAPLATVIRCRDYPGQALQDYLERRQAQNPYYAIFDVGQESFSANEWVPVPPQAAAVQRKLQKLSTLHDLANVGQGVVTSADKVFIIPRASVPKSENSIYRPFLHDSSISRYRLPDKSDLAILYPLDGDRKLTEDEMRGFHHTWDYLQSHRVELEARSAVHRGDIKWWELERPRVPSVLLRPKLLGPYISLLPRFALDPSGEWIVRRGPYITTKTRQDEGDYELLRYLLGLLNSSLAAWYFDKYARKYGSNYNRMEVATVKRFPVPDPGTDPSTSRRIIELVGATLMVHSDEELGRLRRELDDAVIELYKLTQNERLALGE